MQSSGFLNRTLRPLMKAGLLLMKNILTPMAKSILLPLRLTAAAVKRTFLDWEQKH